MGYRRTDHVTHVFCREVKSSFLKRLGEMRIEAKEKGLVIKFDDEMHFKAEGFNSLNERIVLLAGPENCPFVAGPSLTRRVGYYEYSTLLLPKN